MKVEFISVENVKTPNELAINTRLATSSRTPQPVTNLLKLSKCSLKTNSKTKTGSKEKTETKSKQKRYNCPLCKIVFTNKKSYEHHKSSHQNDGKYECDICQQSFADVNKLFIHIRKHDGKTEECEKYQCNICHVHFIDINDLHSHVRLHFDLDIRYKCSICENSFFDVERLLKHTTEKHKNIVNTTFICYICGQLFSSIDEFIKHDNDHKKDTGLLNCSECGEAFPTISSLNMHKKTHTISRTQPMYVCQKCNLKFSRSEDLHNHVRVHDGKSIYSCALCDRMFAHSKNLTSHVSKCHKSCFAIDEIDIIDFVVEAEILAQVDRKKLEKVLGDNDAQADGDVFKLNVRELVTKYVKKETPVQPQLTIERPLSLLANVTRKFTELYRKYKCPLCELIFVKAKTLEIHCKRNHFGNYTVTELKEIQKTVEQNTSELFPTAILNARVKLVQKHECPSCDQMHKSRNDLIGHLKSAHNGDAPYKCIKCSETFSTLNELADHVLNHPDKRHECKFCGLTFVNLYSLGKHLKRHEGPNTESCSICNIPYREKKDLIKHMRIHADGKPHKCLYCDKRFAQSCDRQKHMRIHTGERPYVCKICGKSFAHLTSIKKHNYVHTGERAFQCTTCGKSFQHSSNLIVHNRTHTGEREKPYVCNLCNRAFSQSEHFREHMMIHSGEKPHKCDICDKSFRRSDALQCHKKIHKKEDDKKQFIETKMSPNLMVQTYPVNELTYLTNDNVVEYNEDQKHLQLEEKVIIHDQSVIHQSELNDADHNDINNMESSTITVLRPHQTDMGEQTFNTFSYNFIL